MTTLTTTTAAAATSSPWSFLGDESFWLVVASLICSVLASVGLGHLGATVRAVIDASAAGLAGVYVGGRAHQKAAVINSAAAAVEAGVNVAAPPDVARIADQAAALVAERLAKAASPAG